MDPVRLVMTALNAGSTLGPREAGARDSAPSEAGLRECTARDTGFKDTLLRDPGLRETGFRTIAVHDNGHRDPRARISRPREPAGRDARALVMRDAHARLWSRVRQRLAGRPDGVTVLARHAEAPRTWAAPLAAELAAADAAHDVDLIAAAIRVLRLTDEAGYRSGLYAIDGSAPPAIQRGC